MDDDIYRIRLKKPLKKNVLNFLSSLRDDLWIAEEDIIGTEVHNIMLYEQGILNKNEIKKILISLENIKQKLLNNKLELDENFEDIHPFIEKCVIDEMGIENGGKIHTGRSRNDQVSLDIRLKIRNELNYLSTNLFDLFEVFQNLAKKTILNFIPLYTHLQKAQLGVFAHFLNNYCAQILRSLDRIDEIYKRININPLGACAIGGTSININRQRTTALLGFFNIIENSIDAISSKDYILETLMCLSIIAVQLSRIAEDLLLWSSKEFNFVEIDDQFCSVSSVMPQKKNPDTIELVRSRTSKILSAFNTASIIVKTTQTGYLRDFQDLKPLIRDSFDQLHSILEIYIDLFSTIKINSEQMQKSIHDSYILALDLAEFLVNEYNIPFRNAHKIVAELVRESKYPQDMFNKESIERLILKIENKEIKLPENFVESFKDLNTVLKNRISQGSPSKIEVEKLIRSLKENKTQSLNRFTKRVKKIEEAKIYRESLIKKLIS